MTAQAAQSGASVYWRKDCACAARLGVAALVQSFPSSIIFVGRASEDGLLGNCTPWTPRQEGLIPDLAVLSNTVGGCETALVIVARQGG